MKSKKFLAAIAAVAAVSAVATTGLVAQAEEENTASVDVAPEVSSQVDETPVTPPAPVVEKSVEENVSVPEPTVLTVDEPKEEEQKTESVDVKNNDNVDAQETTAPAAQTAPVATTTKAAATTKTAATATTQAATATTKATTGTYVAYTNATKSTVATTEAVAGGTATGTGVNTTGVADGTASTTTTVAFTTVATKSNSSSSSTKTVAESEKADEKKTIDYNKIYTDYVNDDILKNIEGGLASLEPNVKNPEKDYVRKELLGLVSAQIYDFGGDGVEELLTVTREQIDEEDKENDAASFLLNLYQYDKEADAVKKIGDEVLGSFSLKTEGDFAKIEEDYKFQLAIVGDSIYFVEDQNDVTSRTVFGVDTKDTNDAIKHSYSLMSGEVGVTDTEKGVLYVNKDKYKEVNGVEYSGQEPAFETADEASAYIRQQLDTLKVPVNDAKLVDSKDGVSVDVDFDQKKVTMLTQYEAAPKFKTVDFTGLRGNSHPAGTSEKKNDSSSKDGATSSPKTGDSRVPVAAGAAAVAAAAAAVAFVTKKKN